MDLALTVNLAPKLQSFQIPPLILCLDGPNKKQGKQEAHVWQVNRGVYLFYLSGILILNFPMRLSGCKSFVGCEKKKEKYVPRP